MIKIKTILFTMLREKNVILRFLFNLFLVRLFQFLYRIKCILKLT